jgi:carnitine-CoA ligase
MASKTHLNQAIISHLLEIKADETPDREIMVFEKAEHGEDVLTYRMLYENSNKIAGLLLKTGVGKGDAYAIFMRNHPEFVYAMLAGPVIGAIMIPIDPRSRGQRLRFLLQNSRAKVLFVTGDRLGFVKEAMGDLSGITVIAVHRPEQGLAAATEYPSLNETLESDIRDPVNQQIMDVRHPMQIIYTSGTTGDPKGVLVRNNRIGLFNIVTRLVWKYQREDVLYSGLSLTHGNAQAVTLFPSLTTGIKSVFSPGFTKSRIWDICRKYGCTSFSLLGGMMAGIFNEPVRDTDGDNPVKTVISAGTPPAVWEDFEKRFNVRILEWYGAVEGGFAYRPPGQGPVGSFGKPLPGMMEFRVVDEADQPVSNGEIGELIVRMIKGETRVDYLDNPEASREKTRGGWLRTGDMVHRDGQGWYFFHFRKGSELRRAGDFIQPDHIERVLGEHPDVSEVCVYGIPAASGAPGECDLVAAVAPFPGHEMDPESIFALCKIRLEPNYIPAFLQLVDRIPKTISEKALDRVLRNEFSPDAANVFAYRI